MPKKVPNAWGEWRENVRELTIVILGVFIALVAQQLADDWQWRHKVAVARAAMHDELLSDDGPQIYQRAAMHPCVVARLDAIRAAAENGRPRQEIAALIDSYWIDVRTFDRLALDSAVASDVAGHMPDEELHNLTVAYEAMPLMERINTQEAADVARLRAFSATGGTVSADEKARVLGAVEALRSEDDIMWRKARVKLPKLFRLGPLDPVRVHEFMADAREHYGDCVKDLPPNWPN
jgi:hypothetical protein